MCIFRHQYRIFFFFFRGDQKTESHLIIRVRIVAHVLLILVEKVYYLDWIYLGSPLGNLFEISNFFLDTNTSYMG